MATMIEGYCPDCAALEPFEQPPCFDGHGADCPEWLCLTCGTALLIDMPVSPQRPLHRAPQQDPERVAC
jgi:hypothetical protein